MRKNFTMIELLVAKPDEARRPQERSKAKTRANSKSFTMIELLVVIVIILILAALLMPVLGKAKMTARIVACANNKHQIGIAGNMYAKNRQGKYPVSSWKPPAYWGTHSYRYPPWNAWYNLGGLHEEIGEANGIFHCPTRWKSPMFNGNNILPLPHDSSYWGSTTSNYWRGDYVYRYYINNGWREPSAKKDDPGLAVSADFWMRSFGPYFHGGVNKGVNVLYLDGSVGKARPGFVSLGDGAHSALETIWKNEFDR
jgi:prepilin-type processing-associated H-X9-DG protein